MGKNSEYEDGVVSDYCFLNGREDARLSDVERLTLLGGAGLNRLVNRLGKSLSNATLDAFAPGLDYNLLKRDHEKLLTLRADGSLAKLFSDPGVELSASVVPIHGFPIGGVYDLEFHSTFPRDSWGIDPTYGDLAQNQTSFVRLWEHDRDVTGRKTIVAIHGWTMGDQRVNSLAFLPGLLFTLGFNVALLELPFHGRRRPEAATNQEPLFPNSDPIRTCVTMGHAISDLRVLARFLRSRGHGEFVSLGMSLGAYVGLLWAALDKLNRGVFIVPLVSMGDMAFELSRRQSAKGAETTHGLSVEFLRDLFLDHFPLRPQPETSEEDILIVGGEGDHLVPRAQIALLRERWPRAKVSWVPGGHGAAAQSRECFEVVHSFLGRN